VFKIDKETGEFENYIVDKTCFIKEMIEDEDNILLTIPTGWGKSLNINMLHHYLMRTTYED